jgi:hypothetical protein
VHSKLPFEVYSQNGTDAELIQNILTCVSILNGNSINVDLLSILGL